MTDELLATERNSGAAAKITYSETPEQGRRNSSILSGIFSSKIFQLKKNLNSYLRMCYVDVLV